MALRKRKKKPLYVLIAQGLPVVDPPVQEKRLGYRHDIPLKKLPPRADDPLLN
jgi:hypothetical protein